MDPRLAFAIELERRDAGVAQALAAAEALQGEIDELHSRAATVLDFLASLPAALGACADDERAAETRRTAAAVALREAEAAARAARREHERLEAERTAQQARADLHVAERWVAEAAEARRELAREAEERRSEAQRLEARAAELGRQVRDLPKPAGGVDGARDWASRARGALIVERSGLARQRDGIVREASELLGSVLGEPLTSTTAAGLRRRLEHELDEPPA